MRILAATLTVLSLAAFSGEALAAKKKAPSKMLDFVKPEFSLPVTVSAGEGKQLLAKISAKERAALDKTGVVVSNTIATSGDIKGVITAYVIVKQPKQRVWELLQNPEKQYLYLPRLSETKIIQRDPTYLNAYFKTKIPLFSVESQIEHKWYPEVSRLCWGLDPNYDNDLKQQDGYYNIYDLDGQTTLIEMGTLLEASALVPSFVQDYLTKTDLPEAMAAVKKYMDTNGAYRKKD
jgi:hypothetical protein